jgi:predicted RND superfamily exporter protein
MWDKIVGLILRNRISFLIGIALITCFMGYRATKVQLSYEMARMLPANDKNLLTYQQFKTVFGEDGNVIFVGFQDSAFFQIDHFNQFYTLCEHIQKIDGIEKVLSVTNVYSLVKDDSLQKFNFLPLVTHRPNSQAEVDSLKERILSLKFYDNLLFNKESSCYMTGITLTRAKLNDKGRILVVKQIKQLLDNYALVNNLTMHYSGLPYIRTVMTQMIQDELYLFIIISLVISILIMILFFRSFAVVATSLLVV